MNRTRRRVVSRIGKYLVATALGMGTALPAMTAAPADKVTTPPAAKPDAVSAAAAFRTYHGGSSLNGVVQAALPPAPVRLWKHKASSGISQVPVTDGQRLYAVTSKGEVFALDLKGTPVWSVTVKLPAVGDQPPATASFDSPIVVAAGKVILGSGDGFLYGLDAATGAVKWKFEVGSAIMGSPTWIEATDGAPARIVVMAQPDGTVYAVNAETGEKVWAADPTNRCDGSPAADGGRVAFGNCDASIHVLSAVDGKYLLGIPFGEGSEVAGGVAMDGTQVFSGSRSGTLYGGDLVTGKVLWSNTDSSGELFTTPAVGKDRVVFAGGDGNVYAVNRADGKKLWMYETGGITVSSPLLAGDRVVLSVDGKLVMLSLDKGEKTWSLDAGEGITGPAVAGACLYVGTGDGQVLAFGPGEAK